MRTFPSLYSDLLVVVFHLSVIAIIWCFPQTAIAQFGPDPFAHAPTEKAADKSKEPLKFDSAKWKADHQNIKWNSRLRPYMLQDLLRSHHLVGLTATQAVDLLGPPEIGGADAGFMLYDIWDWFGVARSELQLKVQNGKVLNQRVINRTTEGFQNVNGYPLPSGKIDPKLPEIHEWAGRPIPTLNEADYATQFYAQQGNLSGQLASIDKQIELWSLTPLNELPGIPSDPKYRNAELGRIHLQRARVLVKLNRNPEAVAAFKKSRQLGASTYWELLDEGQLLTKLQRYTEAISIFNDFMKQTPRSVWPAALRARAAAYKKMGNVAKAASDEKQAKYLEAHADELRKKENKKSAFDGWLRAE
jgi:tetratricopeptide (TPR) repeat protein